MGIVSLVDFLLYPPLGLLITLTFAFVWLLMGVLLSDNPPLYQGTRYDTEIGSVLMVIGCVLLLNGLPSLLFTPGGAMPFTILGNLLTCLLAFGTFPLMPALEYYYEWKSRKHSGCRCASASEGYGSSMIRSPPTNPRVLAHTKQPPKNR